MADNAIVHLVDDDEDVRRALAFLLGTAGFAVRVYESAVALLETLDASAPGCIVSDVRMPGMDGIQLLQRLKDLDIQMPVIIMTGHADVGLAVAAMKAGAVDFVEKPFSDEVLICAIQAAMEKPGRPGGADGDSASARLRFASLSERELQVLKGLVGGLPNKTIAYDLGLSPRTVEVHRANVMKKTGAASLSELVRLALVAKIS